MRFEHFALNVPDSRAMSRWYAEHLGFRVAVSRDDAAHTHFLADDSGRIIVEIYTHPRAPIPNYASAHALCFHIAVVSTDARSDRARLETAGARLDFEDLLPDGSLLIMMRDPWGIPLQVCQRAHPLQSLSSL